MPYPPCFLLPSPEHISNSQRFQPLGGLIAPPGFTDKPEAGMGLLTPSPFIASTLASKRRSFLIFPNYVTTNIPFGLTTLREGGYYHLYFRGDNQKLSKRFVQVAEWRLRSWCTASALESPTLAASYRVFLCCPPPPPLLGNLSERSGPGPEAWNSWEETFPKTSC